MIDREIFSVNIFVKTNLFIFYILIYAETDYNENINM